MDKQIPIQEEIAHLTARLRDEQTTMARRAVCGAVAGAIIGLVIGADWIIGAMRSAVTRSGSPQRAEPP